RARWHRDRRHPRPGRARSRPPAGWGSTPRARRGTPQLPVPGRIAPAAGSRLPPLCRLRSRAGVPGPGTQGLDLRVGVRRAVHGRSGDEDVAPGGRGLADRAGIDTPVDLDEDVEPAAVDLLPE